MTAYLLQVRKIFACFVNYITKYDTAVTFLSRFLIQRRNILTHKTKLGAISYNRACV